MSNDYETFIEKVKRKTAIDLALYKEAQMKRRLTSLYEKRGFTSFHTYYDAMTQDEHLFNEFLERMTINVSEFFRNASRWDVLEKKILPRLYRENNNLKVWSAACSTGEEPYTLSMILSQFMPLSKVSVLATDLDKEVLKRAALALYPERSIKEVPNFYLKNISIRIQWVIK